MLISPLYRLPAAKVVDLAYHMHPHTTTGHNAWHASHLYQKWSGTCNTHTHTRPGAHGAVGAALAAPTFGPKMGVSNMWACLMSIVHLFFNHCNYRSSTNNYLNVLVSHYYNYINS